MADIEMLTVVALLEDLPDQGLVRDRSAPWSLTGPGV